MNRDRYPFVVHAAMLWLACTTRAVPVLATAPIDLTGASPVAGWLVRAEDPLADEGPHGLRLSLRGGEIVNDEQLGCCLVPRRGPPDRSTPGGALAPADPVLSPPGPFAIAAWISPAPGVTNVGEVFLLDKKYATHTGYQLVISAPERTGARRLIARLGFGRETQSWTSEPVELAAGRWRQILFAYDGRGTGWFFVDGSPAGRQTYPERGGVAPNDRPLAIGDRLGSDYYAFPGRIAQVRLAHGLPEITGLGLGTLPGERRVFVRGESNAMVRLALTNWGLVVVRSIRVEVRAFDSNVSVDVAALEPGGVRTVPVPVPTNWRPDAYPITARARLADSAPTLAETNLVVRIVPRRPPRMPVVMWGIYSPENVLKELPRLRDLGFTHCLGIPLDAKALWAAPDDAPPVAPARVALTRHMLDVALADDFRLIASLSPGSVWKDDPSRVRVDPAGRPLTNRPNVCAAAPGMADYCRRVGRAVARAWGDCPAFEGALLHSEVRDAATICYHPHDREAARQAGFLTVPTNHTKSGRRWDQVPGFPPLRLVPDEEPTLAFLRWWWKHGDGWNALNTAVARGLREGGVRAGFWTFHDPAVRVASVWGSGGDVDVLSHWTYSNPDPIRIGLAADELLAMAAGAPRPTRVMKMTQAFWYRSQTAPANTADLARAAALSPWEDTDPDAKFLTISPDHLRIAFWCKIARPVAGIMYHGWQAIVPTEERGAYRHTHPGTQTALRELLRGVVEPLGPALLEIGDAPRDAALLESFAAQMWYAGRGTYGWGRGWAADLWHAMTWAHIEADILYDETVLRDGLDRYRLLLLPDCDVLTTGVAARIVAFQRRGGIVVGDERLAPGITPDIRLPILERSGRADTDQAALIRLGEHLLRELGDRYRRRLFTTSPTVIPRLRRHRTTDYIFLVNDRRAFGDYVGRHGLVMENGRPDSAEVRLRRNDGRAYDLLAHAEVPLTRTDGELRFSVNLEAAGGRIVMVTDRPIAAVTLEGPAIVRRGERAPFRVRVVDADGQPLAAVVPLRVDVLDAEGREAEGTGWYGARDGVLDLQLETAPNDTPGRWTVRVRELASNRTAERHVELSP
ncbi:MAG: hypothetical protein N2652_12085 [Kiritimatiellae bacterium]|nr:hypothetical protein [Kiritimatiellia bacterium]